MSRTLLLVLFLCGAVLDDSELVVADTVYLKVGGQIDNCRVLETTPERLILRTPQGRMEVPRAAVRRVKKKSSTFDVYDAKYASVDKRSAKALSALRDWCRRKGGLGPEAQALAKQVLEVDPDHPAVRKDLGYIREGKEWVKLPGLAICVVAKEDAGVVESIRAKLALAVADRDQVRIRDSVAAESVHACTLVAKVSVSAGRKVEFYGMKLSKDSIAVSIEFEVQGKLFKSRPMKLRITGKANTARGARDRAMNAAFVSNTRKIQSFLDRILDRRYRAINAALKK